MKLDMRRRVTSTRRTIAVVMLLFFALGFGSALALASEGRSATLIGAVLFAAALYVGSKP